MSWIKRNLFFVVGSVIALALLVGAGFYNFIGWKHNVEARDNLNKAYDELNRLNNLPESPGSPDKVDNVRNALEQQHEIRAVITNAAQHFRPIPPIPDSPRIDVPQFTTALGNTIDRLQHEAAAAAVNLPPGYNFSFQAQSRGVRFAPASLAPLSVKLGEVAAICDVLIQAKINSLDGIRRERVAAAPEDLQGPMTDYLDTPSRTTDLAVLTPYEVTFRSFSSELAVALSGFAASPHGLVVKGINVEPAAGTGTAEGAGPGGAVPPGYAPSGFAHPPGPAPVGRSGLTTALNQKELRITMLIEVVKLRR